MLLCTVWENNNNKKVTKNKQTNLNPTGKVTIYKVAIL